MGFCCAWSSPSCDIAAHPALAKVLGGPRMGIVHLCCTRTCKKPCPQASWCCSGNLESKHCEQLWKNEEDRRFKELRLYCFGLLVRAALDPCQHWSRMVQAFWTDFFGFTLRKPASRLGQVMLWGSPIRFPPSLRSKCVDSRKECARKGLHKLQVLCLEGVKHLDENQSLDCDTAKNVRVHCPSAAFC